MNRTLTFLTGILLGIILGALTIHKVLVKPDKEYVYVDIDKIVSAIAQEVGDRSVPQEALAFKIKELKNSFEVALTDYQREHNAIILSSKPIKGTIDRTDYFIDRIRLQHSNSIAERGSAESVAQPISVSVSSAKHETESLPDLVDYKSVSETPTYVSELEVPEIPVSCTPETNSESISESSKSVPGEPVSISVDLDDDNRAENTPIIKDNKSDSALGNSVLVEAVPREQTADGPSSLIPKAKIQQATDLSKTISELSQSNTEVPVSESSSGLKMIGAQNQQLKQG